MASAKVWLVKPKGRAYQIRWEDQNTGRVRTKSAKTTRRREAERLAGKLEADLLDGKLSTSSKITWSDFKDRYDSQYLVDQADNTCNLVSTVYAKLDAAFPALDKLRELDHRKLAYFQETLRAEGLSIETIKTYLRHTKSILGWAVRQKYLAAVPHIEMPKKKKAGRQAKGRAICSEEFERMLAVTVLVTTEVGKRRRDAKLTMEEKQPTDEELQIAESWKHLLTGLWWSGLRLSEAVNLSWQDGAPISVCMSGKYPALRILSEGQKSGREEMLPLATEFCEFLEDIPEAQRHGRVFRPMARDGSAAPMGSDWVGKVISRIGKAAKVKVSEGKRKGETHTKYASAHDLRRSFATRWVPKVMPATLQKLMRHKSISTTLDFYAEVQSEAVGDELRRLEVTTGQKCNVLRDTPRKEQVVADSENQKTLVFQTLLSAPSRTRT